MLLIKEGLVGMGTFVCYYIVLATLLVIARLFFNISKELFRKLLHLVCFMSVFVLLYAFETWYLAMFTALGFALVLYPIIALVERYPKLMAFFNQRHSGEIRGSLMLVFFMMATLIAVFWGWQGESGKYIIAVSVLAWGFGDAAAALIGTTYGRRRITHPWVDNKKTIEGTLAMFIVAWLIIMFSLMIYTHQPWYLCLLIGLIIAPVCAVVELVSQRGIDTITVPWVTAVVLFILHKLI